MNQRVLMRVLHGFAHRAEQREPPRDRARARLAELRERHTLHILHDEIRGAVGKHIRIVEPPDRRMIELRERALFGGEALASRRREPRIAQHLDRCQAPQVLALREVDDSHASFAEHALNAIRPEALLRERCVVVAFHHLMGDVPDRRIQQRVLAHIFVEHGQHFGNERRIVGALRGEKVSMLAGGQGHRRVKQLLNALPARAIQRSSRTHEDRRSSAASQARAARQSRRIVDSDTPTSSAVSETSSPAKKRLSTIAA